MDQSEFENQTLKPTSKVIHFLPFGNIPQKRKYFSCSPLCFLKENLICLGGKTTALELNFRSQQTTKQGSV